MPSFIGVRHVGLAAKNPAVLAEFYRNVMGMTMVGESLVGSRFGASVFLGAHHEEEDHEMVFFDNPTAAHTAFRVASLGDLQTFYRQVKGEGVSIKVTLNHGSSLAFYFDDPEGNMIEIYWATGVDVRQPYADPIDFDLPEEELLREVARVAEAFGLPVPPM
jgi:catechol-2,3-dioxygenase